MMNTFEFIILLLYSFYALVGVICLIGMFVVGMKDEYTERKRKRNKEAHKYDSGWIE